MPPEVEALIVGLRREHPGWGPRTLLFQLEARGVEPLPGRSSVYRCLARHGLVEPKTRRRKKADYRRWERSRAMELWQMDVVGGVMLADGWKAWPWEDGADRRTPESPTEVVGVKDLAQWGDENEIVHLAIAGRLPQVLPARLREHGHAALSGVGLHPG